MAHILIIIFVAITCYLVGVRVGALIQLDRIEYFLEKHIQEEGEKEWQRKTEE